MKVKEVQCSRLNWIRLDFKRKSVLHVYCDGFPLLTVIFDCDYLLFITGFFFFLDIPEIIAPSHTWTWMSEPLHVWKAVLEGEVVRNYACSDHGTLECSGNI